MTRLLIAVTLAALVTSFYALNATLEPDPRMVGLAVRATLYAAPTATERVREVTRVVEVTRLISITRLVEVTATPQPTPTAEQTPSPLVLVNRSLLHLTRELSASSVQPALNTLHSTDCPTASVGQFTAIPVMGNHPDYPDIENGELNLALRGYLPVDTSPGLVTINGPTDGDAPQFTGLFLDGRVPEFIQAYRVHQWNWGCGDHGCRAEALSASEVSLVSMGTSPGEAIGIPSRGAEIYGGGYKALVLFADTRRITLTYTREDTIAKGYAVHVEGICVDPNLLSLYRANQQSGRWQLPAIRNGEVIGTASGSSVAAAIRDTGTFLDPRSRKDWWQGH